MKTDIATDTTEIPSFCQKLPQKLYDKFDGELEMDKFLDNIPQQ